MTINNSDEYLDLVDDNDQVIGKELRTVIYTKKLNNFRVINAFVQNSKNELWIPRRSANKSIFPLCLDMSVGGHVQSGESYEEAFRRETKEELNIDIMTVAYKLLAHLRPKVDSVSAYMNVYIIKSDQTPNYNKEDFIEYFWLTPKAVLEKINNGYKAKGDLPLLIRYCYANLLS